MGSIKLKYIFKTKIMATSTTNYEVWECRGYGFDYQVATYSSYQEAELEASIRNNEAQSSDNLRNGNNDSYFYEVRY